MAYGALNLLPCEFEQLQPQEFELLLKGYAWREERKEEKTAYFLSWILNTQLKRKITAKEILKPLRPYQASQEKVKKDKQFFLSTFPALKEGGTNGKNS